MHIGVYLLLLQRHLNTTTCLQTQYAECAHHYHWARSGSEGGLGNFLSGVISIFTSIFSLVLQPTSSQDRACRGLYESNAV